MTIRALFVYFLFFNLQVAAEPLADKQLITINKFDSHPALDLATGGIVKAFEDRGLLPDRINIKIDNAQGALGQVTKISRIHAALRPSFMIGVSTSPAQANSLNTKIMMQNRPKLAFVAVTDPVAAELLKSDSSQIGVTDEPPLEALINLSLSVIKNIHTIGVIYNPGEINSTQTVKKLELIADAKSLKLDKITINFVGDIKSATDKLIADKVDVIYVPQDNTLVANIDYLAKAASVAKIPIIANDINLIDKGIAIAMGCDYYKSGEQLGNMIADLMDGKSLSENVYHASDTLLKFNNTVASSLGIEMPVNYLK